MISTAAKEPERTVLRFPPDVREDLKFLARHQTDIDGSKCTPTRYLIDLIRNTATSVRNNGHRKKPPPPGRLKRSA